MNEPRPTNGRSNVIKTSRSHRRHATMEDRHQVQRHFRSATSGLRTGRSFVIQRDQRRIWKDLRHRALRINCYRRTVAPIPPLRFVDLLKICTDSWISVSRQQRPRCNRNTWLRDRMDFCRKRKAIESPCCGNSFAAS